jgi:S-adenosylmethionine:tRNA ribosyltransferase-isomerase
MLEELKHIPIADYDYPLPDERIARYPLAERDQSKLLALTAAGIAEHRFYELPQLLTAGSLLVFNDTKVIHARLLFRKETGATIEIFCLEPVERVATEGEHPVPQPVSEAFEQRERCSWMCFIGNNKKWKEGTLSRDCGSFVLTATRRQAVGNAWVVDFSWTGGASFAEVIENAGVIPLPPYLGREAEESDATRYQTVYAHYEGSVAAPTAGLHFTDNVIATLHDKHIDTEYLTLHVGAGTFKPVSSEHIGDHEMHVEKIHVTSDNLKHIVAHRDTARVAVGTTSVRTLESLYWFGVQLQHNPHLEYMHVSQWDPYTLDDCGMDYVGAYSNILAWMKRRGEDDLHGETQLMIAPGYRYRTITGMVTNFHQPKSTLLLLVSAFIGDRWKEAYRYALDHGFRFLSYGDSCLFMP